MKCIVILAQFDNEKMSIMSLMIVIETTNLYNKTIKLSQLFIEVTFYKKQQTK
jgi:hypothetical protein